MARILYRANRFCLKSLYVSITGQYVLSSSLCRYTFAGHLQTTCGFHKNMGCIALLEDDEVKNSRKPRVHANSACSRVHRSDIARTLLEIIRQAAFKGEELIGLLRAYKGLLEPPAVGEVLNHLANVESASIFFDWARSQEGYTHLLHTYNCLLDACVRAGAHEEAYRRYLQMREHGYTPDEYSCSAVLLGFSNARAPDEALKVMQEMARDGITLSTNMYNIVIEGFCKEKKITQAKKLFNRLKSPSAPNADTYNTLLKALAAELRLEEAKSYYMRLVKRGIQPTAATYSIVIEGYSRGYMLDEASALLSTMLERGFRPRIETHTSLMNGYLRNWNAAAGYSIFKELVTTGYQVDGTIYQAMLDGFWKSRMVDEARSFLKDMVVKGFTPSERAYSKVIVALALPARINEAYQVFEELLQAGHSPNVDTCVCLINQLTEMDRVTEAFRVYEKMIEKNRPNQGTFHAILVCLCKANKVELAHLLLREVVYKFQNFVPKIESYNCLFFQYCGAGHRHWQSLQLDKALKLLDQMVHEGRWPSLNTFQTLIHGLCKGRRAVDAYRLFLTIKDFELVPDLYICRTLIQGLCRMKKVPEAEVVFDHVISDEHSRESEFLVSKVYQIIVDAKEREQQELQEFKLGESTNNLMIQLKNTHLHSSTTRKPANGEELEWSVDDAEPEVACNAGNLGW